MAEPIWQWNYLEFRGKIKYLKSHATDCNFIIGRIPEHTQTFPAHKFVLGSVSEVFERMFNGEFKEAATPYAIKLIDVEPNDFKPFLDFIYYNNSINFYPLETWIKLVYLGKKYMIKDLHETCHSSIKNLVISPSPEPIIFPCCSDLLSIFDYTHLHEDIELLDACKELLLSDTTYKDFRTEAILKLSCIYGLNSSVFYNLLTILNSHLSHCVVFTLIETYAKINSLEMDSINPMSTNESTDINLAMMLDLVDYRMMSLKDFYNGPAQSTIITMNIYDKYNTFLQICKKNERI